MTNGSVPAGWYRDPTGQGDARYWNGVSWTESVDRGGVTVNVAIDPSQAQVAPVPGTQVSIPQPAPATQTVNVSSTRSPWGAILGVVVVVLVVIGIIVVVSNNDSSDDSPTPGSTPAAPPTEAPAAPATDGG